MYTNLFRGKDHKICIKLKVQRVYLAS